MLKWKTTTKDVEKPRARLEVISTPASEEPPSVTDMIDGILKGKTKKLSFFRPSMLAGCKRANVFHYQNAPWHPQQQEPRFMRILDVGSHTHSIIQGYLADLQDWWFAPESRIYTKINGAWVRGSCDGVLIRRRDMYRVGIEIKTINHNDFMKLTAPKEAHVRQATIYASLQNLEWIVILYWDKDKQNIKEFPVKVSKKLWEKIKLEIEELKGYVDREELPKYNPSTCDKTFCSFVEHCRSQGAPV